MHYQQTDYSFGRRLVALTEHRCGTFAFGFGPGVGCSLCNLCLDPTVSICHPIQRQLISTVPYVDSQCHGDGAEKGLISMNLRNRGLVGCPGIEPVS